MNRGSEWRRWELHLHTPFTNKEDEYVGKTEEEKWDNFYASIRNYIGDNPDPCHAICAIAITDYLSIDNYLKVRNDKRLPDCVKLIMPNVELRMTPIASNSPINIHCIFDPSIADDLDSLFFSKLQFEYNGTTYSATKKELIRLGKDVELNRPLTEEKALQKGLEQYVIQLKTLSKVFKENKELKDKTVIVVSNKSSDGVSGLREHSDYFVGDISQLEATRRSIYQLSDMIFSSRAKDIEYFLGEGVDSRDVVIKKLGSLKPCIHGCDAHTNAKVFAPDQDRFCWIKADPTFEGFKQVIYEPKERVRISSVIPDEKSDDKVIDRVEIINNKDFSPAPIYFSDKLTCIIGGKSTGKSLLLDNMARAVDRTQVEQKKETVQTIKNAKQLPEMKVYWRDGICSDDENKERKIVYIPQTYLNRLSDEEQETTEIDNIIQSIIFQNPECKKQYNLMLKEISKQKQKNTEKILEIIQIRRKREELKEKSKEFGDESAIKNEISRLEDQLSQISKEFNLTENEITEYQEAIEKANNLNITLDSTKNEIDRIQDIQSVIDLKDNIKSAFTILGEPVTKAFEKVKGVADETWLAQKEEILIYARKKCEEWKTEIGEYQKKIDELKPKMENNERIKQLSISIMNPKVE